MEIFHFYGEHNGQWKNYIFLFAFHPKNKKEISFLLKRDRFLYPVFIDEKGGFDALNHLPSDVNFQTFLLDSQNKVIAIGNPVHNKKVRDLYLQIITGRQTGVATSSPTKVVLDKNLDEMGDFDSKVRPLLLVCGILAIIF